jgi:DNA-binding transcriptional LysR family regulator
VSGTLRLASLPTFGRRYIIPVIHNLMEEHRELRVELDLTERLADPVLDRLDAVIRIGALGDSNLIAAKLADPEARPGRKSCLSQSRRSAGIRRGDRLAAPPPR